MILSFILIWPLAHAGLALASSLSSWLVAMMLCITLLRRKIYTPQPGWGKFLLQLTFSNSLLGLFLWSFSGNIETWFLWSWPKRFLHLSLLGIASTLIYLGSLWISKVKYHPDKV
jgi:putative peptidoglycan lipid II flippase